MRIHALAAAGFLATMLAGPALADTIEIKMLNKGADGVMVFEPAYVKAKPGDTINFVATDKGHDVESVKDMIPAGVAPFKGKMNENYTLTVTEPGAYLVKCTPHYSMGMAALIVVGDNPSNLDAVLAAKKPKFAQQRIEKAMAAAK